MKKIKIKEYILKIDFAGDSNYSFQVYKPRKMWFPIQLWTETIHRNHIINYNETAETIVLNYEKNLQK